MSTAAPNTATTDIHNVDSHNVTLPTPEQLPNDLDTLKGMIVELMSTLRQAQRDSDQKTHRIQLLLDRLYGKRTERVNPDQLLLFAEWAAAQEASTAHAVNTAATSADPDPKTRKRKRTTPHGRGKLPADLPRQPVHHLLGEAERLCRCGQLRLDIGTDASEQVDWQPASVFVWQHLVHKYLCPSCGRKSVEAAMEKPGLEKPAQAPANENATEATGQATAGLVAELASTAAGPRGPAVISAPRPPAPIAKGLPGAGLLAYVIVSKYLDHLPLHRLERILARQGLPVARSTLCDWMAASAKALQPLYDLMVSQVLQSAWLHTDDTPVKNKGHQPGTTALSRFWIYWGDRTHPYNVFDFTINRKRDGPQTFLADFHGYLHADAFSGYDALYLPSARDGAPIIEVACNAHARRKFYEARTSDDLRAHQALAYYAQLYFLERGARDAQLDDAGRWQMRQDFSVPILKTFQAWLEEQRPQVLPKSPMAEAIGYALNNWTALSRYTAAGFLSIDNNIAEREMKRIAIGRKNWLFVGSDKGGQTAAVLFSFTSTCHRLGVEPWAYLQDVLTRLPTLPAERLAELLPDRWQAARAQPAPSNVSAPALRR
jgi:transposase